MKKSTLKHKIWLGIFLLLAVVVGIFAFRIIRHQQTQQRAHTNAMALIDLIHALELGETMTLDDIPFAWDSHFIYAPYTPVHANPTCMERNLLFQQIDILVTYLCFFYNDQLVARFSNRHRFPEVFRLVEHGAITRESEDVMLEVE